MKSAGRLAAFALAALAVMTLPVFAGEADLSAAFAAEEIKPYIKIMQGPWSDNALAGSKGNYRITARAPRDAQYVIGLFDHKVGRAGADERCAVVLVDGVNPLAPSETVPAASLDAADVGAFRKVPLDGITFNAQDGAGRDCYVKVVDAKEDGMPGPVVAFSLPAGRPANALARVDVFVFAGPALSPVPGQAVEYGKPLVKYAVTIAE